MKEPPQRQNQGRGGVFWTSPRRDGLVPPVPTGLPDPESADSPIVLDQ